MRKIISILLALCLTLSVFAGCTVEISTNTGGEITVSGTPGGNNQAESPESPDSDYEEFIPQYLGDASFTVDAAASATGEFLADSRTPLSLNVTDSNGQTWTLVIPANALSYPETITMTAMSGVTCGELGSIDGGVLLEPDGTYFISPATLKVTGGKSGTESIMLTGNHDGSNVTLAEYEHDAGATVAYINHFSTAYEKSANTDEESDAITKMIESFKDHELTGAQRAAVELLKKPIGQPPAPPSLTFKCPELHSQSNRDLSRFLKKFNEPERPLIEMLFRDVGKFASSVKSPDDINVNNLAQLENMTANMALVVKLFQRLGQKAQMLIDEYKYQEDKFYAVLTASSMGNILFGISEVDRNELNVWGKKVWNELMEELVEKHEFSRNHGLFQLYFMSAISGADLGMNSGDFMAKMSAALTFSAEFQTDVTMTGGYQYKSSGEARVIMDKVSELDPFYHGMNTGEARYDKAVPTGNFTKAFTSITAAPFQFTASLYDLDTCDRKQIKVGMREFGPESETQIDIAGQSHVFTPSNVMGCVMGTFYDTVSRENGLYCFDLELKTNQLCAEETFTRSAGGVMTVTITLEIYHTPGNDVYLQ